MAAMLARELDSRLPSILVFNPFAEGYIAHGKAFTPVKHQAMLASDLANLPQFLCDPQDVVLVTKRPSADFLEGLKQAGFLSPEFVELKDGRIDPDSNVCGRKIGLLQPWAWAPDSVELLEPFLEEKCGEISRARRHFNDDIARLYSKAWSATFLRKILAHCPSRKEKDAAYGWLCTELEAGVAVNTLEDALEAVAAIRARGHHRVIVKEAHGLAGHNSIRLWEPEMLRTQRQWLAHALRNGRQVLVEPWLERELDFSIQLEMEKDKLRLCGYTGLLNDRRGQFQANWAEKNCLRSTPAKVAELLGSTSEMSDQLERLYAGVFVLLEEELHGAGFVGPVSIDAFVYRARNGEQRLKPVVEINPRYTMGRLTLELMQHAGPGSCGLFRLVTRKMAKAEGFADFSGYARTLRERHPLRLEGDPTPRITQGALCLNDPEDAQVCVALFEVGHRLDLTGLQRLSSAM